MSKITQPCRKKKEVNCSCCSPPGGCQREDPGPQEAASTAEQESADSLATAAIITEDPHAVLVEFSSVVADTQEYIIKVRRRVALSAVEVFLGGALGVHSHRNICLAVTIETQSSVVARPWIVYNVFVLEQTDLA